MPSRHSYSYPCPPSSYSRSSAVLHATPQEMPILGVWEEVRAFSGTVGRGSTREAGPPTLALETVVPVAARFKCRSS
eukprot:5406950-Alexandrium_andersonii.AAC.1